MNRRIRFFAVLIALVLGLTLAACGNDDSSAGKSGDDELTLGVAPDIFYSPFYISASEGFFEKHGIKAKLVDFPGGTEALEAIMTGQADVTNGVPANVTALYGKDAPAKTIGLNMVGNGWFALVSRPGVEINTIDDIKGLKFAAQFKSSSDYVTRNFLAHHNADVSMLDYKNAKIAQMLPGLAKGDFDVVSNYEPNVSKILESVPGSKIVLDSDQVTPLLGYTIVSKKVYGNPDLAKRVNAALADGMAWMKANEDDAVKLIMKKTGLTDEALVKKLLDKLTLEVSFAQEAIDGIDDTVTFFQEVGVIPANVKGDTADLYDFTVGK